MVTHLLAASSPQTLNHGCVKSFCPNFLASSSLKIRLLSSCRALTVNNALPGVHETSTPYPFAQDARVSIGVVAMGIKGRGGAMVDML